MRNFNRCALILTTASTLISCQVGSRKIATGTPPVCPVPTMNVAEWKAWVRDQATKYPNWDAAQIQADIAECGTLPADVVAVIERVKRLSNIQFLRKDPNYSLGFTKPNEEYLDAQPQALMELPDELKNGMPQDWEQLFVAKGWAYSRYRSGFVENPPNQSRNRVLVKISAETHDQWIQITLPPNAGETLDGTGPERMLDLIVVEKKDSSGKLSRPRIHFRQYVRDEAGGVAHRRQGNELGAVENCYSCHTGGMRDIIPEPGALTPENLTKVQRFNADFRAYGPIDWHGTIETEDHGPALGQQVGCAHCHDGVGRGALNPSADLTSLTRKVINELSMPPTRLRNVSAAIRERQVKGSKELTDAQRQLLSDHTERNRGYLELFNKLSTREVRTWLLQNPMPLSADEKQ